jgi:hypothetical protein
MIAARVARNAGPVASSQSFAISPDNVPKIAVVDVRSWRLMGRLHDPDVPTPHTPRSFALSAVARRKNTHTGRPRRRRP